MGCKRFSAYCAAALLAVCGAVLTAAPANAGGEIHGGEIHGQTW